MKIEELNMLQYKLRRIAPFRILFYVLLSSFFILNFSCGKQQPQIPANKAKTDNEQQKLMALNKILAEQEEKEILDYIKSNKLELEKSPLGFCYRIDTIGNGSKFEKNDMGLVLYSLSMLNGTTCYNNEKTVVKKGTDDEPRGIDDALGLLREGGSGFFIIPSNIAFGLVGDRNCVTSHATIIYKASLLEVKKH